MSRQAGPDVRVWMTTEDDLFKSHRAADMGSARELAEQWRQALLAKGFVAVVPVP